MDLDEQARRVADEVRRAGALVVTAGAGMGVDSGLPDFRGDRGFWKAYPMYERLGLSFVDCANPGHFARDPAFGWGFYGHRAALYRDTVPHPGFQLLLGWAERFALPTFVVTSNVDGQFQKAGFDPGRMLEVHGSIHHAQCSVPCSEDIREWREDAQVDPATMRARVVPRCPACDAVARPNILMFGDWSWVSRRTDAQHVRFEAFLRAQRERRLLVVELGAGTAVPTIRHLSERLGARGDAALVRINVREPQVAAPHLSLAAGALEALAAVERQLGA